MMTRTEERVYARRYARWSNAVSKFFKTVGTMIAGVGIAWVFLNALFPNTPLQ